MRSTKLRLLASLLSAVISSIYIAFGVSIFEDIDALGWVSLFAMISISYGIISLLALYFAMGNVGVRGSLISKYAALIYFVVFTAGSFDVGRISGLEFSVILMVGLTVISNWFLIRNAERRTNHAALNSPKSRR